MKLFSRIILIFISIFFSCTNDMATVNKFIDAETEPDMLGENIEVLFSDSARLQMRLTAPLFKQFNSASEQRREFPQGLHVWLYEKTGELKAELTANWAKQDLATEIWEARSNVVVTNADGQKLETEELFWDPKKGEVYSTKYTKIINQDGSRGASGETFWALQDFSHYKFPNKSGVGSAFILYYEDENETDEINQP